MRVPGLILAIVLIGFASMATSQDTVVRERRLRAAAAFRDGILLMHASSEMDLTADGSRQDMRPFWMSGRHNRPISARLRARVELVFAGRRYPLIASSTSDYKVYSKMAAAIASTGSPAE
jgi:hypothetical protein